MSHTIHSSRSFLQVNEYLLRDSELGQKSMIIVFIIYYRKIIIVFNYFRKKLHHKTWRAGRALNM